MTSEKIKEGLLSLDKGHPFYVALLALLDGDVLEEQGQVTAPGLANGDRQFAAGRLAHAVDLRRAVEGVIVDAERERTERLAKEERMRAWQGV